FQALSAALYARRDEQRGRYVEASLMHGAAWLNTYAMLQSFIHGGAPPPPRPPNNVFRTADGWLHVVVAGHRGWAEFCAAIDRPELANDSRFDTTGARQQNADLVVSICSEILATRPTAHWIARPGASRRAPPRERQQSWHRAARGRRYGGDPGRARLQRSGDRRADRAAHRRPRRLIRQEPLRLKRSS
ncbi:MAG: CoA transferase, partial [Rhodospirillales bacterium]|nr:CoA transferase [Rhodospirillales bacterium]